MSGLAKILHAWGYRVTGSDAAAGPQVVALRAIGIQIVIGHDDPALAGSCDVLVTTLRAEVAAAKEIAAARAHGALVVKRGELLGMIANQRVSMAVAGTHGKSTTSGMLTVALRQLGQDPSYGVGAVLGQTGTNAAPGTGKHMVVEADEFDRAFLFLRPHVAVITSVSFDHPDIFADQADYDQAFVDFALNIVPGGRLVLAADDPGSQRVRKTLDAMESFRAEIVTFGHSADADWVIARSEAGWFVTDPAGDDFSVTPIVAGDHNIRNTVAAVIALQALGFESEEALIAASSFTGVQRRFEFKGTASGIDVVDDYAHHPDEIDVTIATARQEYPGRRLVVVHQPHTYSRTKILLDAFASSMDAADLAVIMDIYPSGETNTLSVSADDLASRMRTGTIRTHHPDDTVSMLLRQLQPGDALLTLGAGTVTGVGAAVLTALREQVAVQTAVTITPPSKLRIQEDAKLSLYTTMRLGGPADYLIRATTPDEIIQAFRWGRELDLPITVIGGGSNLLVSDAGIRGLTIIVKTSGEKALRLIDVVDEGETILMTVPAQAPISGVGRYCAEHGWSGMDWAVGLPGQIGGATVNNAGAHGTELKDHLVAIDLLTESGDIVSESVDWLDPAYRMTRIKGASRPRPWVVLRSAFRLPKGDPVELVRLADDHAAFRKRTQPTGACSGSTFANPDGDYAGRLLEVAGLKGFSIGAMQFSPKHANWVVNTGGGTAADAWALIQHGRRVVLDRFGVALRPEVERVGEGIDDDDEGETA
jgi:UDP-N-acetylmuramate--L-alanine ligase/UDP-N-acetylenolpyruvoylglucosamine reductase